MPFALIIPFLFDMQALILARLLGWRINLDIIKVNAILLLYHIHRYIIIMIDAQLMYINTLFFNKFGYICFSD
jgi:hypothetical protein